MTAVPHTDGRHSGQRLSSHPTVAWRQSACVHLAAPTVSNRFKAEIAKSKALSRLGLN